MRKLVRKANIARREHVSVRRSQEVIDFDACPLVVLDARRLQAQSIDIRRASGADDDLVNAQLFSSGDAVDLENLFRSLVVHADDLCAASNFEAVSQQGRLDTHGGILIFADQNLRRRLE